MLADLVGFDFGMTFNGYILQFLHNLYFYLLVFLYFYSLIIKLAVLFTVGFVGLLFKSDFFKSKSAYIFT